MKNAQAINGELPPVAPFCRKTPPIRFDHGQIVATPAALRLLKSAGISPFALVARHVTGDWGDCGSDVRSNEQALITGARIMSVYRLVPEVWLKSMPREEKAKLPTVWVITDAIGESGKRAVSTLLLPGDY